MMKRSLIAILVLLMSTMAGAAVITDFGVYASRNVTIGVGTVVGSLSQPTIVGAGTTVVGVGDATLNGTAGIHGDLRAGDDVVLGNNSFVTGTVTNPDVFTVGSGVIYGAHVKAEPDLPTLPAATEFSNGTIDKTVANNATLTLAPGSYQNIQLGGASTLNLTAGNYYLRRLSAGNGLTINVDLAGGDLKIYLTMDFYAGGTQAMNLTGGDWYDVYVEAHEVGVNAFQIAGGNGTNWKGTVFTPHGDIHLGSGSSTGLVEGYLWAAQDVVLEHGLDVTIPEPATMSLLALGGLALLRRRRR